MHSFKETRKNQVTLCSGQILQQMTTFIVLSIRTPAIFVAILVSCDFKRSAKSLEKMKSKVLEEIKPFTMHTV